MKVINRGVVLVFVSLILVVGMGVYTNNITRQNKILGSQIEALKKDPQNAAKDEIKNLVEKLSKLVVLPEGEDPVVATVTDKEKLKGQSVFAKAENGDKILIFAKAQKAYIYSPVKNVLVDVVPVNIGSQQQGLTGVDENNPLTLALINGSKNSGITEELEKRLMTKNLPGLKIVSKTSATVDSYEKTLVIDTTGKKSQQTKELASLVNGMVATESSEVLPKADIVIVVGADFK